MIRRIKVRGYKSFKQFEAEFSQINIVVGPNASGKSNLFDLLDFISRLAQGYSIDKAFEEHRGDPWEAFSIDQHYKNKKDKLEFEVKIDVELSEWVVDKINKEIQSLRGESKNRVRERLLRYYLKISMDPKKGHLSVEDEAVIALKKDLTPKTSRRPFLERIGDNRLVLRIESQAHPRYYELGTTRTVLSEFLYIPQHPHVAALREELAYMRFFYLEPSAMRRENPLKEAFTLRKDGSDLAAYYYKLSQEYPRDFKIMLEHLKAIVGGIENVAIERTDDGKLRLKIVENSVEFSANLASEGTLRVLALLAITHPLKNLSLVGFEEPENGVHPARLRRIADIVQSTLRGSRVSQMIINTHSPDFPDYFDYFSGEVSLIAAYKENGFTKFATIAGPLLIDSLFSKKSDILKKIANGELRISDLLKSGILFYE